MKRLAFLFLAVDDNHLNNIGHCLRAKEAWDIIEQMYSCYGLLHQIMLLNELFNMTKDEGSSVLDYVGKIQSNYRKISIVGIELADQTLALIVLMGLPLDKYEGFVRSLERKEEKLVSKLVKSKLLKEEKRMRRADGDSEELIAKVLITKNDKLKKKKPKKPPVCFTCVIVGHKSQQCEKFKEMMSKTKRDEDSGPKQSKLSYVPSDEAIVLCASRDSTLNFQGLFLLHSGASDHMVNDAAFLEHYSQT